jgi:transposase-like protein
MPWKEQDRMSLRRELVELASSEGVGIRELCRRFGVSPKTAYTWMKRDRQGGLCGPRFVILDW